MGLVLLGIYAVASRRHLLRILLGLGLLEGGVNLFLVAVGYRADAVAPIVTAGQMPGVTMVDPIPQALILTSIVIGVGVLALGLALVVRVHDAHRTLDVRELSRLISAATELPADPAPAQPLVSVKEKSP